MRGYDIGTWNMNVSAGGQSTRTVTIDGGMKNPDAVMVSIYADGEFGQARSFERFNGTTLGGSWKINGNGDVELLVNASGPFDTTSYDSLANSRGRITCIKFSDL